MLIDTHAHLYLDNFNNDIDKVIHRALRNGIKKIILPNIDEKSVSNLLRLQSKYPEILYPALGLHPNSVTKDYKEQIRLIFDNFDDNIISIGEIGIDLYWDKTLIKEQIEAFRIQLDISVEKHKPIIIHSRKSMNEIFNVLEDYKSTNVKGVFHCYSGSYEQAIRVIENGFYLGIGGVLTFRNTSLVEVIKKIPVDNIILETDSPFLSPDPYRGKRNEPSYIIHVAKKLAEIKNVDIETIFEETTKNVKKCFNFDSDI